VIQIESLSPRYNGIYTVMDTGPAVQGREIDIYMWDCNEALAFGRRSIGINVLRLGWNPRASAPAAIAAQIRAHETATAVTGAVAVAQAGAAAVPLASPPGGAPPPAAAPDSK
jgi:hypothetical protein